MNNPNMFYEEQRAEEAIAERARLIDDKPSRGQALDDKPSSGQALIALAIVLIIILGGIILFLIPR